MFSHAFKIEVTSLREKEPYELLLIQQICRRKYHSDPESCQHPVVSGLQSDEISAIKSGLPD